MRIRTPKPGPGTLRERDQLLSDAIAHIDRASICLDGITRAEGVAGVAESESPIRRATHRLSAVWADLHDERERVRSELREVRDA